MKLFLLVLVLATSHTIQAQTGAFTPVDPSEVANNQQLQDLRDFGANYVIEQGIKSGELPDGQYVVSDTLGLESQVVSGINYKFDVELTNGQGLIVQAEYVVYYQAWTNTTQVTSYSFIAINSDGVTIIEEETVFPSEEEFEFILEEESVFWNAEDFVEGEDAVAVGGYTQVDLSDVSDDEDLQDLLNFGAQYVVAQGIQIGRLPNNNFVVSEVLSVYRQVVNGVNYKFNVKLTDGQGFTIIADYVVYSQLWSGKREVTSYSFDVISAANGPIAVDEPSDDTDGEPEASLPGGWAPVDPNEVNTDQNLRDILDFGVQYVIAQGAQSGQLASSNYYVEEVNNVEKQVVNGENYRFNVDLENPQGGDATVTFVVYQPINGERQVSSYSFSDIDQN